MRSVSLFLLLLISSFLQGRFENLNDLVAYAQEYIETPQVDNQDWTNPVYVTYHQDISPNIFKRILQKLGLASENMWSPQQFKDLLYSVVPKREVQKLSGRKVAHLRAPEGSRLYVWSDIHGAFHSLVRGLVFLRDSKVIDDNLRIQSENDYLVFNGDFIDRSAYTLESLTIMLLLMNRNPDQIFYIRGKHEDRQHWKNYGLRRDLKIRAQSVSEEKIPLEVEINAFFNTLPLALYVSIVGKPSEVIRISHANRYNSSLNEEKMANFFSPDVQETVSYYDVTKKVRTTTPVDIQVSIATENWIEGIRTKTGLGLQDQDIGATAWSILSSPIPVHKTYLDFKYDAFAVITLRRSIRASTIAIFNQDSDKKDGFKKVEEYNIVTGVKSDPKKPAKAKDPLSIGTSAALVTGLPFIGRNIRTGMSLAINEMNQKGVLDDVYIRSYVLNDNYLPHLTQKNVEKLINDYKVKFLLLPVGSPTIRSYFDRVKNKEIYAIFTNTGAPFLRHEDYKAIIHLRTGYIDEIRELIDYMIKNYGAKKFAFFYQDDSYGLGPLKAAHEELKKRGITNWIDVPYTRGEVNFKTQAKKIIEGQPDVIGFISIVQPTQVLIRELGVEFLSSKHLFAISPLNMTPFQLFIDTLGLTVVMSSVVPSPFTSQLPIVKDYRAAMDRANRPYDVYSLEAYISARLIQDALEKISRPITPEKIIEYFETLKDYDFHGLRLNFDPKHRTLLQKVWVGTGPQSEWIEKDVAMPNSGLW